METGLPSAMLLFAVLLVIALLIEPFAARRHLPTGALLVLAGFAGSELAVGAGFDLGLRWHHFHDLVIYVLLPVLVFAGALCLDPRALLKHWLPILLLAMPLYLLAASIAAWLLYLGVGEPVGFPWITALVSGLLIAATDPGAVAERLHELGAPPRLTLLLEGESLGNDAITIVAFTVLLGAVGSNAAQLDWSGIVARFSWIFSGGLVVGGLIGALARLALPALQDDRYRVVATLAAAYLGYTIAELLLGVSGVMAVLIVGLLLGDWLRRHSNNARVPVRHYWETNLLIANSLAYLLVGVTVTTEMFTERWLAMLIGIGAMLAGRMVAVTLVMPLTGASAKQRGSEAGVLIAGGLRGPVTAALALSLPAELEGWWTAQAIGYGVVLFTLFVQEPLAAWWLTHGSWLPYTRRP